MGGLKRDNKRNDTAVIMKVAKRLPEVIGLLRQMGLLDCRLWSKVGLEGEKLVNGAAGPFYDIRKAGLPLNDNS